MKTLSYPSQRAWLAGKKGTKAIGARISATDVPVLMGSNTNNSGKQFQTREELLERKLGRGEKEDLSRNDFVQFGNDWELAVSRKVQKKVGPEMEVIDPGKYTIQVHPENEWATATCDFFLADTRNHQMVYPLETKTGSRSKWIVPPEYYVDQLQWQMYVTGCRQGFLAVLLLPEYEEQLTDQGRPQSLRHTYFEALRCAWEGNWEERDGGIPRILKAYDESEVRLFKRDLDEARVAKMVEVAEEFKREVDQAAKEVA